jgi:hypothetical protein
MVASGLIGDPRLEVGLGTVWVIVLVILAVVPVVPIMPLAVRALPVVVDMDVVVLLAVERLLLACWLLGLIDMVKTPTFVTGLLVAVILGAIWFTVLEVTIWVVVLGVLVPLIWSRLLGQDRRSHKHHRRQQPQKYHQPSQLILLPKASSYSISR